VALYYIDKLLNDSVKSKSYFYYMQSPCKFYLFAIDLKLKMMISGASICSKCIFARLAHVRATEQHDVRSIEVQMYRPTWTARPLASTLSFFEIDKQLAKCRPPIYSCNKFGSRPGACLCCRRLRIGAYRPK